jgi:hypothetical protein
VEPVEIRDGAMPLPTATGLGVHIDAEVASWTFDPGAGPRLYNAEANR